MSYCKDLGLDLSSIFLEPNVQFSHRITKGAVIEIFNFGKSKQIEYLKIVRTLVNMTQIENVNLEACLSKIHRVISADKKKRGHLREQYREEEFVIPIYGESTLGVSAQSVEHKPKESDPKIEAVKLSSLTEKLQERRTKVLELTEKKKQLKRKLERKEKQVELSKAKRAKEDQSKTSAIKMEKQLVSKNKLLEKAKIRNKQHLSSLVDSNRKVRFTAKKLEATECTVEKLQSTVNKLEEKYEVAIAEKKHLEEELKELLISNDYLQGLLQNDADLFFYDPEQNKYTPELVECAMNLTNLKVASKNVGPVIKEVAGLCGRIPNKLPSRSAVDNFNDRKLAISQKHLGSVAASKSNTTLYTDETRKYGHTYMTYLITDKERNSYLLGLREMVNKSGQCTLDTLKDILGDIESYCKMQEDQEEQARSAVGIELLANISNTMSDRASTEKNFNKLLLQYKHEIFPEIQLNFNNLTENEQQLCSQINNFYCGLHLLIGIADVCEAAIKKFETEYLDGNLIGSAKKPELQRYHKAESGTLRLLRTSSKAFAMGEDERNGVYLPWKTYLNSKGEKKNYIQRFKHNRFNMIFMTGQSVFYHHEDIHHFLCNVHGTVNNLLRAVKYDSEEPLYLAGARVLGLLSKFVTAPLWRLIESPGHILDMNAHYQTLVQFLDTASTEEGVASDFLYGNSTPFPTPMDENDKVLSKLIKADDKLDPICLPLLQTLFRAIKELLTRMIPEHLPEGQFWNTSPAVREQTTSVMKHNKLPEFIFGQLDHLLSFRPNASVLANEAYLMYAFNKTSQWLRDLQPEEREATIENSRKGGREIRKQFQERLKEIENKRLEAQRKKQGELERLERDRIRKAEEMTNELCYYGLWQSREQLEEGMGRISNEKELINALQAQLKFRKNVLKQKHKDSKIFNLSRKKPDGKYEKLSVQDLKKNILQLIASAASVHTSEVKYSDVPLLVGKVVEHTFADKQTYKGKVLGVVPGFPTWYNIKYENDDAIYAYNLLDDYRKGELKIVFS